jgi:predicted transcriptional regulator of viral defense system
METQMKETTRSVPIGLAPIVQRLELDQPEIVTLTQLAHLASEMGLRTAPALIAHRLHARGWLLKTGLSGAWEFAPGAHAGPHSRGGPLIPLKAALALRPDLPAAVALASAAWVHGLADRMPPRLEIAVPAGERVPAGLARWADVLRFDARLAPVKRKGVPVQRAATILVHLVYRPSRVRSWGGVFEWLGDVVAEAVEADLLLELSDRPRAVRTRLAYLLQGLWPALAERVGEGTSTKVWFGPRRKLRRHSQRFCVADSVLPLDPATLDPVRGAGTP